MRASIHDAGNMDAVILSNAKAGASIMTNGKDEDVSMFLPLMLNLCGFTVPLYTL